MEKRMSVFGVGPKILISAIVCILIASLLKYFYYDLFHIDLVSGRVMNIAGIVLIAIGLPLYIVSGKTLVKVYKMDVLYTKGVYSICRHPLYTSILLFILPGILLFFYSWILLCIPAVMLVVCSIMVKKEDKYLAERYPEEFKEYSKKVGAIIPRII